MGHDDEKSYKNKTKSTLYIEQSKSASIDLSEEVPSNQKKQKLNADWKIMGDLLFGIRHAAICRIKQKEIAAQEEANGIYRRKKRKSNKLHMDVDNSEWQTFLFEEYAATLFCNLRDKWLQCQDGNGDEKYVKRLFGENSESMPVEHLDVNKSCKYYWHRISTNSKSGMIFFQSNNG